MVEGDKWEMFIPSDLGYGDRGSPPKISGGDTLIFTMEILEIKGDKTLAWNCNPATLDNCSEREKGYIAKSGKKFGGDADAIDVEIERIQKVFGASDQPKTKDWADIRVKILELLKVSEEEL